MSGMDMGSGSASCKISVCLFSRLKLAMPLFSLNAYQVQYTLWPGFFLRVKALTADDLELVHN
jgi:hypothetical protein